MSDHDDHDPYGSTAADLAAEGYTWLPATRPEDRPGFWISGRERELRLLLDEAVRWARCPSPVPIVPFDDFLDRAGKFGAGPRADSRIRAALAAVPGTERNPT